LIVAITLYSDGDIALDIDLRKVPSGAQIDFLFGMDVVPGGGDGVDLAVGSGGGWRGVGADYLEEERETECPLKHHCCVNGTVAVGIFVSLSS